MKKPVSFRFDPSEVEAWQEEAATQNVDLTTFVAESAVAATYPEAVQAHHEVGKAVREGRLERQPCEQCGKEPAEAHHDDYSKPLSVRWLCRTHHKRWHRDNPSGVNWAGEGRRLVGLRLPDDLHARLKALAAKERRTVPAQVIWMLTKSFEADGHDAPPAELPGQIPMAVGFRPDPKPGKK